MLIPLLKDVVYRHEDEQRWNSLLALQPRLRKQASLLTAQQIRMVPNRADIRFGYRIHEQIGLARSAVAAGLKVIGTDTAILHLGYADAAAMVAKQRRNLALLIKEPATRTEPDLAASLALTLWTLGEWRLACDAIDRALAIQRERPAAEFSIDHSAVLAPTGIESSFGRVSLLLWKAHSLLQLGQLEGVEALTRAALAKASGERYGFAQAYSALILAGLLIDRGGFDEARDVLSESHRRYPPTDASLQMLARCTSAT